MGDKTVCKGRTDLIRLSAMMRGLWEIHDIYWLDLIHLAVAAKLLEKLRKKATVEGKDGL